MRRLAWLALSMLAFPSLLQAQVDPDLERGVQQVEDGDFEAAIPTLEAAAQRLRLDPGRARPLARALLHLGIAHVALDQREAARARFREALQHDPGLRLTPARYSPKVIAEFEQARRESGLERGGGRPLPWILGGAAAAAAGVAIAAGGDGASPPPGTVSLGNARFATPVILCPDGSVDEPLPYGVLIEVNNGRDTPLQITSVTVVASIVASPSLPAEVGFTSIRPATVVPATVPSRTAPSVQVESTLLCGNGRGDPPRQNEWTAITTLVTSAGTFTIETLERLRVNLP
jgi:hypothetical protein